MVVVKQVPVKIGEELKAQAAVDEVAEDVDERADCFVEHDQQQKEGEGDCGIWGSEYILDDEINNKGAQDNCR